MREQLLADLMDAEQLEPPKTTRPRTAHEAEAKWREAIAAVEFAQVAGGGEALAEARRCLEVSCTKSAAHALMAVADAGKTCEGKGHGAFKSAARAVRYLLVVRCRLQAAPGVERAFIEAVEEAFGRRLDNQLRSLILLAYHKVTKNKPDTFPSSSQLRRRSRPRGPRGPRGEEGEGGG